MPATTPGYYLQSGGITCHVDSLIPFTLRFTRDGARLGVDQLFKKDKPPSRGGRGGGQGGGDPRFKEDTPPARGRVWGGVAGS